MSTMTPYEALDEFAELIAYYEHIEDVTKYPKLREALSVLRSALEWHTELPEKDGEYYAEVKDDDGSIWYAVELYSAVNDCWSTCCTVTRWTHLPTPPEESNKVIDLSHPEGDCQYEAEDMP